MIDTITVPRELFEALVEEAGQLRALSGWKDHPTGGKFQREFDALSALIERAKTALKDSQPETQKSTP
jgi:hypothetical protein